MALRDAVDLQKHREMSAQICSRLSKLSQYKEAKQLLFFVPYGSEVDIFPLMQECMESGRTVFCPLVAGDEMEFYRVEEAAQLVSGYKGIKEPIPDPKRRYIPGAKDFMILPGTAFDREGNRIGYGKGFYDRFLAKEFTGDMAAPAFCFQLVDIGRIPAEDTDRKINCIVTEKEIIRI